MFIPALIAKFFMVIMLAYFQVLRKRKDKVFNAKPKAHSNLFHDTEYPGL